jgi:hypothetical protein
LKEQWSYLSDPEKALTEVCWSAKNCQVGDGFLENAQKMFIKSLKIYIKLSKTFKISKRFLVIIEKFYKILKDWGSDRPPHRSGQPCNYHIRQTGNKNIECQKVN